jgi:lysine 2,3-aminomutase
MIRVRPYYLYMMDKILGGSHFGTSVEDGLNIINQLRGWTSGYAVPQFIIDTHDGKIPLLPNPIKKDDINTYTITSFKGKSIKYKDIYMK